MSDSSSGSGTGTGSGKLGENRSDACAEGTSGEDDTDRFRRAMNNVELRLARSQATVIIHNLMQELTTFVTRSLGGATGEEDVAMTEIPEEHRHTITAVDTWDNSIRKRCTTDVRQLFGQRNWDRVG